jgi:hypothetical protein
MFIELGTIGQGAWAQSVDMLYSKDPEKKKKIIDNALAGKALDSDSTSYSYIPDLDAFTSVEGFATSILSQAASDLGGCFRKYQHLARYSPFNPEQNLSRTNKDPVSDNVDGKDTYRNSFGTFPIDYQDRDLNVCKGGISGSATPDIGVPDAGIGGEIGTANLSDREKWIKSQKNIKGRLPNGVNISNYGRPNDPNLDTNTANKRGSASNLLREGSVALSPDIYRKYTPQIGSSVYVNGQLIGYYEDRTPDSFNGKPYYQTIDVYDTKAADYLKNTGAGPANITFGPPRKQIPNP